MSLEFNEVDQYLSIADHAALTLPDADFTLAFWVKFTDNAGSGIQYLFKWGTPGATPSFHLTGYEGSHPTLANRLRWYAKDNDGTAAADESDFAIMDSTAWQHVALVRYGLTWRLYRNGAVACHLGVGSDLGGVDVAAGLSIGQGTDANTFFGGRLAETAKWDRAITSAELAALVVGASPAFFPASLKWCLPLRSNLRDYAPTASPLVVTNYGATWADHPTIGYPLLTPTIQSVLQPVLSV